MGIEMELSLRQQQRQLLDLKVSPSSPDNSCPRPQQGARFCSERSRASGCPALASLSRQAKPACWQKSLAKASGQTSDKSSMKSLQSKLPAPDSHIALNWDFGSSPAFHLTLNSSRW